jgi:hypothetical protein
MEWECKNLPPGSREEVTYFDANKTGILWMSCGV